jgi:hypothetical protein
VTRVGDQGTHPESQFPPPPPAEQRQALTAADREALHEASDHAPWHYTEFGVSCSCGQAIVDAERDYCQTLVNLQTAVEAIVARHVTAALNEAAEAIEAKRAAVLGGDRGLVDRLMLPAVGQVFTDAAAIVRNLAANPQQPSARA